MRQFLRFRRFGFFWKKEVPNPNQSQSKPQEQTKEQFLKELREKRIEAENIKIKNQRETQFLDQRAMRENEVNYGSVDYAKVYRENLSLKPTQTFNHPEELFNFIVSLRTKLTEENLVDCLQSFIMLSDKIEVDDMKRLEFLEFLKILESQIRIISKDQNLVTLFNFLDLFCISEDNQVWGQAELLFTAKISKLPLDLIVRVLEHISNQHAGGESFWDTIEGQILTKLEQQEELEPCIKILICYFKSQKGTKEFIQKLHKMIKLQILEFDASHKLTTDSLIWTIALYSEIEGTAKIKEAVPTIQENSQLVFQMLEDALMKRLDELKFSELCHAAAAFGFQFGSQELIVQLEKRLKIENITIDEMKLLIKGFIFSYRGSKQLFQSLRGRIIGILPQLKTSEVADIVKAYYLTENEESEFLILLEKEVVSRLKQLKEISIEDITSIAKSYLITRVGSREMYRLLEIVIRYRFNDIAKDAQALQDLQQLYLKSGLCSAQLLADLEQVQ